MTYEPIKRWDFQVDPKNGMLIGPDGCHYETQQEAMYSSLGLCGCGSPEEVHELIVSSLAAFDRDSLGYKCETSGVKLIEELVKSKPDVAAEFIAHFLSKEELTEHGGSVYGSWLTERGKQFLEIGPMKMDDT